jgi:hypothetical protein
MCPMTTGSASDLGQSMPERSSRMFSPDGAASRGTRPTDGLPDESTVGYAAPRSTDLSTSASVASHREECNQLTYRPSARLMRRPHDSCRGHVPQLGDRGAHHRRPDEPRREIVFGWALRVQAARDLNHLVHVVRLGETTAQEYAAHMDVVCDVAAGQLPDRHMKISVQDFDT